MDHQLMNQMQQYPASASALWALDSGRTLRLPAVAGARRVKLIEGRLWLTADGSLRRPGEDVWLSAGDEFELSPSVGWVAEASPQARFLVLVPPQTGGARGGAGDVMRSFSAGAGRRVSVWLSSASSAPSSSQMRSA
jgi:hypothetical protein